ncbi:5'-methylthioadenosine/adenosylhomocysteine nucleosidase [Pollutimonas bauzanensis]|uniref:5'-methylthioadenosine/adenosylhomocysteine nucleosidase n=1 Tax=Pollutimonas bauzanensis TaxID=658167 RepID=UPI003340F95E
MSTIGILAALHDEIATLLTAMGPDVVTHRIGQRDYHVGMLSGRKCVLVLARVGKVAAAATAVTLIREFKASVVVFTGLAGAVADHVRVGDVVVAKSLLQHDLDARPLFAQYEVPLLGRSYFDADARLAALLAQCANEYLNEDLPNQISAVTRNSFGVDKPAVHSGTIISGDVFVSDTAAVAALRKDLPDALCVEMEGAAVAQICYEYGVPCGVLRTISDRADCTAGIDFGAFLAQVASFYSAGILRRFLGCYVGELQ